jgi:acylphosphatase
LEGIAISKKALKVIVTGRVIGVDLRTMIHRKATSLSLTGFVKAVPNRKLEVFAEGDEEELEELLEFLHEGTKDSEIEDIEVSWQEFEGLGPRFRIEYTVS